MKIFLTKILPLLLPLAIYFSWLIYARRKAAALGQSKPGARDAPWLIIISIGLMVLIGSLIALGIFTGEEPGGVYVPPHMENGEIVPGRIERE